MRVPLLTMDGAGPPARAPEEREFVMDNIWIWLIIAVIAIALIAIVASAARKKAAVRKAEHNRHRAGELRQEAELTGVEASQREADAAAARADAEQARVAAEKLERDARQHEHQAGQVREAAGERLVEADRVDPDIGRDGRHEGVAEPRLGDENPNRDLDHPEGAHDPRDPRDPRNDSI